jgi:hypothetical protein
MMALGCDTSIPSNKEIGEYVGGLSNESRRDLAHLLVTQLQGEGASKQVASKWTHKMIISLRGGIDKVGLAGDVVDSTKTTFRSPAGGEELLSTLKKDISEVASRAGIEVEYQDGNDANVSVVIDAIDKSHGLERSQYEFYNNALPKIDEESKTGSDSIRFLGRLNTDDPDPGCSTVIVSTEAKIQYGAMLLKLDGPSEAAAPTDMQGCVMALFGIGQQSFKEHKLRPDMALAILYDEGVKAGMAEDQIVEVLSRMAP